MKDPNRFGVAEFNADGTLKRAVEKPKEPPSPFAITGIYFFNQKFFDAFKAMKPSARGEYEITDLEPSIPYYVAVTSYDFGSRKLAISSLESSPNTNAILVYPLPSTEVVEESAIPVSVYPNPYRIDGGYAKAGYENRDRLKSAARTRIINFANLPNVCTIRIYTVSGDLVSQIDHNDPDGSPMSQHESWNLISRNTQAVVTGIYLWHVQSAMGEQVGKLVIIK